MGKKERVKTQLDNKTIKELLGELYDDRDYLENLLTYEDRKTKKKQGQEKAPEEQGARGSREGATGTSKKSDVRDTIVEGLNYLDKRTEFWQQQRPMYARKRDQKRSVEEALSKGTAKAEADHQQDPTGYVVKKLEEIDDCILTIFSCSPSTLFPVHIFFH